MASHPPPRVASGSKPNTSSGSGSRESSNERVTARYDPKIPGVACREELVFADGTTSTRDRLTPPSDFKPQDTQLKSQDPFGSSFNVNAYGNPGANWTPKYRPKKSPSPPRNFQQSQPKPAVKATQPKAPTPPQTTTQSKTDCVSRSSSGLSASKHSPPVSRPVQPNTQAQPQAEQPRQAPAPAHERTSSFSKQKPFKSTSITKDYLKATPITSTPPKGSGENTAPAVLAGSPASQAGKARLVTRTVRDPKAVQAGSTTSTSNAQDGNTVWNRNKTAPTPTPKSFTDEELKQHFGISMATRLEADEPDKQFKWADLDDEGGWQPSPPQWMDGSKSSMPTTEKPQEPPATEQSQKPTPNLESSNEESAGPKAILKPTSKPAATTKPGLVLKSVPEGPPTPTKNTDSSSSKSPWASLPAVDKASPIAFVSPADRKDAPATGASKDLSTGESKIDTNAPPRVINADSFSRDYDGSYAVTSKSRYDFKTNTWKLVDAPTASDPESGASKIMHPTTLLRRPSQSVAQQEDVTQNITPAGADDIDKMHRSGMSESVAKAQAKKQQLAAEEQRAEEAKRQRLQAKIAALGPEADTANTATVKPDSSGNENPQSSLAEQRHQTITQPWNSSTASGNHPSQGWSASTGSSGNVWGPPGNDKTLGNGVFASDLNQYRPSELQSPGPIAPPSAAPLPAPKAPEARVDLDSNTKPQRVAPMNTASNVRSSARGPAKAVTRPADTAAATRSGIAAALQAMGSTMGAAAPKQAGWSNFAAGIKSSDRILDAEATTRGRQPRPEATSVALKETFHQTTEDGKVAGVTQHKFDLKKQQEAKDESSKAIDAKQPSSVKADAPKPTVDSAGTQHTRRPVDNAKVAASKPIQQSLEQTAKPVAQTEATQTQVAPPQAVGTSKPTPKTPSVSSEAVAQSEPAKVLPAVDASSVLGSKAGLDRIDEPMMHTAHPTSVELGSNPAKSPLPFSHSLGARTSRFFGVGGGLNAQTPISKPPNHPHTPLQPPPSTDHYLHAVDPSSQPIVNLPKARPVVNIPKTLDVEPVADTATEPVVMTPRPQLHAGQKPIVTQAEWQSRFNNLFNRAFGTQDADVTEGTTGTNEEPSGVSPLSKSPFCPHEAAELAAVLIPILQKYYVAPKHEYMLPIHEAATKDSERVLFNGHAHKSEPDITFPEETDVKTPGQDDQLALNAPFSEELSSDFGSTVDILEFPKEDPMQVKLLPKVDLKSDTAASAVHAAPTNAAGNKPVAKLPNWAIPKDTSKPPTMPQYDGTGEGLGKWAEWGRYGIPKGPDGKPLPRPGATKKAQSQPSHPSNAPKQQQPAAKPQADDPNPKFGMGRYDALADGQMA